MGFLEYYKPIMAMLGLQFLYASVTLTIGAAVTEDMSPRVFVTYRSAIATLIMAPIAYFSDRGKADSVGIGLKSFGLMFIASLLGVAVNQNLYFEGMYLSSASVASAMSNLLPAITFLMAACMGLEKVELRSLRSMAKVMGTIICVIGAVSMALLKGPKLLNSEFSKADPVFFSGSDNWVLGCLLLCASCCCWSFWLVLQVPMSECYPDHLSLSAWMCVFATGQSAILGYWLEPNASAWKLNSSYKIIYYFYTGLGSGVSFYVQSWCISKRGPVFSAMFSPLCTVIVTVLACLLLHEKLYIGSLMGAAAIVLGLYAVLWGKAEEYDTTKEASHGVNTLEVKPPLDKPSQSHDIVEPLLTEQSHGSLLDC